MWGKSQTLLTSASALKCSKVKMISNWPVEVMDDLLMLNMTANMTANDGFLFANTSLMPNTTEIEYTPYQNRPETYIIPILFAFIFIVGVVGNGTLIIVFLRHRAMRNVPNTWVKETPLSLNVHFTPFLSIICPCPWQLLLCQSNSATYVNFDVLLPDKTNALELISLTQVGVKRRKVTQQ